MKQRMAREERHQQHVHVPQCQTCGRELSRHEAGTSENCTDCARRFIKSPIWPRIAFTLLAVGALAYVLFT